MQPDAGKLAGIVDIEFGPPVTAGHSWVLAMAVLLGLLLVSALLVGGWRSERARGLRRLTQMRRRCRAQGLDARRAAFELAAVLQRAIGFSSLSARTPLPARLLPQQARWQRFNRDLATARYAPPGPSRAEIERLLREARYWLRHWR
jgi:hypothetical protein